MGHSRQGKPSSSNFLAALHSGLEQAHDARAGPYDVWASPVLIAGIVPDEKLDGLGVQARNAYVPCSFNGSG
jgi:hypothetical protein